MLIFPFAYLVRYCMNLKFLLKYTHLFLMLLVVLISYT